jgi:caffeoyl-CoA O-methyltransferase
VPPSAPSAGSAQPSAGAYRRAAEEPSISKFTPLTDELHSYLLDHGVRQDEVLARIAAETAEMGSVARMQIAPDQGAFMTLLVRALGVREAVELGTFTGYSAICIARGLAPGGRLIACELSEEYAEIASRNFTAAGVADRIEIRIGPAAETLREIPEREAFDFGFIDADKVSYPEYYELVLARTRQGGLIVVDNVLAGGRIADDGVDGHMASGGGDGAPSEQLLATRRLNDLIAEDDRVDVAMVAIADGLTFALKR